VNHAFTAPNIAITAPLQMQVTLQDHKKFEQLQHTIGNLETHSLPEIKLAEISHKIESVDHLVNKITTLQCEFADHVILVILVVLIFVLIIKCMKSKQGKRDVIYSSVATNAPQNIVTNASQTSPSKPLYADVSA
jgi:hypothetical protein